MLLAIPALLTMSLSFFMDHVCDVDVMLAIGKACSPRDKCNQSVLPKKSEY